MATKKVVVELAEMVSKKLALEEELAKKKNPREFRLLFWRMFWKIII